MDYVFVKKLELFGRIGVLDHEKETGQVFILNINLGLDLKEAGLSDSLVATVDYSDVCSKARDLMDSSACDLLETYAETLACELFESYPKVSSVEICIEKPDAPISENFESVGVRVLRTRND